MDVTKFKISDITNSSLNLAEHKILQSRPHAAMFIVSFANFKFCVLSCDPSGDASCLALKSALELGLLTEMLL